MLAIYLNKTEQLEMLALNLKSPLKKSGIFECVST
jgi:hypothetical protein